MFEGKVVGNTEKYEIHERVARGAFSEVYRCTKLSNGKSYAIKIINLQLAKNNKMEAALSREVDAMERVGRHDHVVGVLDKLISKRNMYIVMELIKGGTLLDFTKEYRQFVKSSLPSSAGCSTTIAPDAFDSYPPPHQHQHLNENNNYKNHNNNSSPNTSINSDSNDFKSCIRSFFKQLLLGLSALHHINIVHRDIKPENILLTQERNRVLISDFGFACYCPPGHLLHRSCGTLKYCAPELLEENPRYDGRKVDVWAAGVTLYVMLFFKHPYVVPGHDPDALLSLIKSTPYKLPPSVSPELADFLSHLLDIDPQRRWSVDALLEHPWMRDVDVDGFVSDAQNCSFALPTPHGAALPPKKIEGMDDEDDGFYDRSGNHSPNESSSNVFASMHVSHVTSHMDLAGSCTAEEYSSVNDDDSVNPCSHRNSVHRMDYVLSSSSLGNSPKVLRRSQQETATHSRSSSATTTANTTSAMASTASGTPVPPELTPEDGTLVTSFIRRLVRLLRGIALFHVLIFGYFVRMLCTLWIRFLPAPYWLENVMNALLPGESLQRGARERSSSSNHGTSSPKRTVIVERRKIIKLKKKPSVSSAPSLAGASLTTEYTMMQRSVSSVAETTIYREQESREDSPSTFSASNLHEEEDDLVRKDTTTHPANTIHQHNPKNNHTVMQIDTGINSSNPNHNHHHDNNNDSQDSPTIVLKNTATTATTTAEATINNTNTKTGESCTDTPIEMTKENKSTQSPNSAAGGAAHNHNNSNNTNSSSSSNGGSGAATTPSPDSDDALFMGEDGRDDEDENEKDDNNNTMIKTSFRRHVLRQRSEDFPSIIE